MSCSPRSRWNWLTWAPRERTSAGSINVNQPYRSLALQLPGGGFPRPFQELNTINYYSFGSNSSYNAAMFSLRKRFSRGTFFRVNYTFGKSIDENSQTEGSGDGGNGNTQDARNLRLERGRSDWDNRHALTMSFVSELPFMRRNRFLGGWQISGSGRMYSGQPFTPVVSNAQEDQGEASRPDRIAQGTLANPSPERWFDVAAFPAVPVGAFRFGTSGRNILDGPGFVGMNLSLTKKFRIRRKGQHPVPVGGLQHHQSSEHGAARDRGECRERRHHHPRRQRADHAVRPEIRVLIVHSFQNSSASERRT